MTQRDVFASFKVDLSAYANQRRFIRRAYPKASDELVMLILNFWCHPELAVSLRQQDYDGTPISYRKVSKPLRLLLHDGYVELAIPSKAGRTGVYKQTPRFMQTFRFRGLSKRLRLLQDALTRHELEGTRLKGVDIASIPELATYSALVAKTTLSLSNGEQVFRDVCLRRIKDARLYQMGNYGYQTLPREERALLLIDGQPTTELDYASLHPTMLFNMAGKASPDTDIYADVLKALGIRVTKNRRAAVKLAFLIAISFPSVRGFPSYVGRLEEYKKHLKGLAKPGDIYRAVIDFYPELKPYMCTGTQHGFKLQMKDSEIMIDVLETLANRGIVALPVHDSVICPVQHKEIVRQVMHQAYRDCMGFDIRVKEK